MKKAFALSTLLATASAGLGAYGWDAFENYVDEVNCAANKWECSTHIPRTISQRTFQYGDQESAKFAAIVGQDTYDNFNGCDNTIAIGVEMDVARARAAAEFANQFRGVQGDISTVEWTPPSADDLFEAFKHVADNKLGFRCGAIDADYFAEPGARDDVLRKYAQTTKFDYRPR